MVQEIYPAEGYNWIIVNTVSSALSGMKASTASALILVAGI